MTVPPVPTPAMKTSGWRSWDSSCHQISGPVVVSCAAQLSSFANCRGRKAPGVREARSSASSMAPRNPPWSWLTGWILAPKDRIRFTRSGLIQSGMKIATGWPRARPIAENEMPVLPLVASMISAPGSMVPRSYALRRMCSAIRSFTLPVMFRFSLLAKSRRGRPRKL